MIAVVEVISQGLGYAYLWLMISVALWLGYTVVKRRRMAADTGSGKKAVGTKATAQSDKQGRSSAGSMPATKGGKNRSASKSGRNRK